MEDKTNHIFADILNSILTALICVVAFLLVVFTCFCFVYTRSEVVGTSMQPLLNPTVQSDNDSEEFAFVNRFGPLNRNNVVVANVPWCAKGSIIKRLVGMPGDLISVEDEFTHYALYVNDELFYTRTKTAKTREKFALLRSQSTFEDSATHKKYIQIKQGEYFLLGDNWEVSDDSSTHGPVKAEQMYGRVDFIIHKNGSYVWQYISALIRITFTTQPMIFC